MRIELADDAEIITDAWLNEWAAKQPHSWDLPGTDLFVAHSRNPLKCNLWVILCEEEDGSETVLCHVQNRGDIREALTSLGIGADGKELELHW